MEPRLPSFCPPPSTSSGLGSLGAAKVPDVYTWHVLDPPLVVPLPGTGPASREDKGIWAAGCHPGTQRCHSTLKSPTACSVANNV